VTSHIITAFFAGGLGFCISFIIRRRDIAAQEERLRLAAVVENSDDAINSVALDGTVTSWNGGAERTYGYSAAEALGRHISFCVPPERRPELDVVVQKIKAGEVLERFDTQRLTKNGKIIDVSVSLSPIRGETGKIVGVSGIARDVTAKRRALEALVESEKRYRSVSEREIQRTRELTAANEQLAAEMIERRQAQESLRLEAMAREQAQSDLRRSEERMIMAMKAAKIGFWDLDVAKDEHVWSDTCKVLLGVPPDTQASYQALKGVVHPDDWEMMQAKIDGAIQEKRDYAVEFRVVRPDNSVHWRMSSGQAFYDDAGHVTRMSGITMDIDDRKNAEERIQHLAYSDALTGLPNRALLHDRLANALADARRQKYKIALLFLDLDRFKNINDSLGHSVGDLLLQKVAERLKRFAREQDTVARLGGDEFLIMLTHVKDVPDAAVATERLMDAMTAEFVIEGHHLNVSCSVGISIFPEHGADSETLIKNADRAMYSAKESGRNGFRFFTEDMDAQAVERLTLESSLRLALDKKELFLVYQPQMDIASGKIIGLEALLRWQHPKLGLVLPDKFIRIAENSGLIVPIGEWVLRTACSQARKWQDEGVPAVSVAVNVSAIQFRQEDFCELIRRVLHETGLAPQYLELELTESLLLANANVTLSVLKELKSMGLTLAIDDFGTGYSSFNYLRQFRVSKLKIDRSFIRDIAVNPDDAAITTAIISMAKSLKLKVIAEGVENEAQMSFLRARQCDEIQGYYFSKPLVVDKVADKLRGDLPETHVQAQASGGQS
jgi:diguanylate cyclase (GGDEF)-like protein/PAS domain S-box-containing protein